MEFFQHTNFDHLVKLFYEAEKSAKGARTKEQIRTQLGDMLRFTTAHFVDFHTDEHYSKILRRFGFEKFQAKYDRAILILMLKNFTKDNSLDTKFLESPNFPREQLVEAGSSYIVTENINAGVSVAGASFQSEKNFNVAPTFDKLYITGHSELDNYIRWTLIFKHNFEQFKKASKFQKLILIQLNQYLAKKVGHITRLYREQAGSRFKRNGQMVLGDYLENLMRYNMQHLQTLQKYKIVPYLLEMNGKPGIGKSTYVDFLSSLMHVIFPFYEESDMVYTRVNDKFWNGYKQQPLVLYDDQNQNRDLRYNLDNEIIALGSGQFVHPPMAFEKDAKFSSLFVVFTTNKKLLQTTKAVKGAIARRVHTYDCDPLEHLGSYQECEVGGQFWKYDDDVLLNPFNIKMNGRNFVYNIYDFLAFINGQRTLQFENKKQLFYLEEREQQKSEDFETLLNKETPIVHKMVTSFQERARLMDQITTIDSFPDGKDKFIDLEQFYMIKDQRIKEVSTLTKRIVKMNYKSWIVSLGGGRSDPVLDVLKKINKNRGVNTTHETNQWNSIATFSVPSEKVEAYVKRPREVEIRFEELSNHQYVTVIVLEDREDGSRLLDYFWSYDLTTEQCIIPSMVYNKGQRILNHIADRLENLLKVYDSFATTLSYGRRFDSRDQVLDLTNKMSQSYNQANNIDDGFFFCFYGVAFESYFSLMEKE